MSLTDTMRLLLRHWKLLLAVPLVLAGSIFYFTRHQKQLYASETTIYTGIASGYTLTGNAESDYFTTSNAFDNLLSLLKSRETKEEVAYELLANHLQLKELNPALLGWNSLVRLREVLPARLRRRLTGPTLAATLGRVRAYATASDTNALYRLLNSHDAVYSVEALGKVNATRINASDLIKLDYEAEDAAICRHTLQLTTQVFTAQYRGLRVNQTAAVIRYYELETAKALNMLNTAEQKFLAFNRDNDIINYYEQTKYIAGEREYLYSDINKIEMQYAAATASLGAVDRKLAGRGAALLSTGELLQQRRQLEKLHTEVANRQLFARQGERGAAPEVKELQAQIAATAQAMRTTLTDHYAQVNSVAGIPSKGLLDKWLQNMLEAAENKAKLRVMQKRKGEFMAEYHKMAPLGARLKIIEREIDLAQKSYLVLLNHLNDSRATQHNNELTTALKVVAPAFLPLHAKGGKRLMLVAGGALGGFFFVAATLLGLGLLDSSLRKPSVAARHTGLPVLGVLPMPFPAAPEPDSYAYTSLDYLARQVLRKRGAEAGASPYVIGVVSPRRQEGKTSLVQALAHRCAAMGLTTLALYPGDAADADAGADTDAATPPPATGFYPPEMAAVQGWDLDTLSQHRAAGAQLVLIEFPALLEETYPAGLLARLQLVLLTLKASRTWQPKDQQALDHLRAATSAPVEVVLTGVDAFDSQEVLIRRDLKRGQPGRPA